MGMGPTLLLFFGKGCLILSGYMLLGGITYMFAEFEIVEPVEKVGAIVSYHLRHNTRVYRTV